MRDDSLAAALIDDVVERAAIRWESGMPWREAVTAALDDMGYGADEELAEIVYARGE